MLKRLIEAHVAETESRYAARLLARWDETLPRFRQVVPKEMIERLAYPLEEEPAGAAVPERA